MQIAQYREAYVAIETNTEIAAGAKQSFGATQENIARRNKYGSMNTLILANRSALPVKIYLDENILTDLYPNSSLTIEAKDGIYFNIITLENLDGAVAIAAGLVTARYGRSDLVVS